MNNDPHCFPEHPDLERDERRNHLVQLDPAPWQPGENEMSPIWQRPLIFQKPSLEQCAILLNRLLKFEQPVWRNHNTYLRFLQQHQHPPKWSKKELAELSGPLIETLTDKLLMTTFGNADQAENKVLSLYWWCQDRLQFDLSQWGHLERAWLSEQHLPGLHSHHFDHPLTESTLSTVLHACHYPETMATSASFSLWKRYFLTKTLSHPWPWHTVLNEIPWDDEPDWKGRFQALYQLSEHWRQLKPYLDQHQPNWKTSFETPKSLEALLDTLNTHIANTFPCISTPRPVKLVILVEGATEERLLPVFAHKLGLDLTQRGALIIPAGGKNQVFLLYKKYAPILRCPILILLDRDAEDQLEAHQSDFRPTDQAFVLEEGEMEDAYPDELLITTINQHYQPHPKLTKTLWKDYLKQLKELTPGLFQAGNPKKVSLLKHYWKDHHLGEFDKTTFAHHVAQEISRPEEIPAMIQTLLASVAELPHPHS